MSNIDSVLLRKAFLTSIPEEPSQYNEVESRFVFRPEGHVRALDPNAMLVSGIRGAGKSFWWHALLDEKIRTSVLTQRTTAVSTSAGFGEGDSEDRPSADVLEALLEAGHQARLIWKAVVLRHVLAASAVDAGNVPSRWSEFVPWVRSDPERVAELLRIADETLGSRRTTHVVLFDALDRSAGTDVRRRELLRGLLELVVELRARGNVRAKIFARPDMLGDPDVRAFPDASKVLTTAIKLDWNTTDLYGLLFNYLGNAMNQDAAKAFRNLSVFPWRPRDDESWEIPDSLRANAIEQARIFVLLAGKYMGRNARRGATYPWLPNHISDARGQVSPRSFLAAMRRAADVAEAKQDEALHWAGIQEGVRRASEVRTAEIQEDLPWAHEAMSRLVGVMVPCDRQLMLKQWGSKIAGRKPTEVLDELISVGVIAALPDDRLNVPDLYRVGFGLRRKGGLTP